MSQLLQHRRIDARLDVQAPRLGRMRRERAWKVRGVKHRSVDRRLQVVSEDGVRQEKLQGPLVLLVTARGAESQPRLAVAQRERRAECRAGSLSAFEMVWVLSIEIQHVRAGAEAEAEAGEDRRALQPATAGRARDHVAVTVDPAAVPAAPPHLADGLRTGPRPWAPADRLIRGPRQPA